MSVQTSSDPRTTVSTSLKLGHWQVDVLNGGRFLIGRDAVQRCATPVVADDPHARRTEWAAVHCNCVLFSNGQQTVLIDTGYGGKQSPLDRKFYALEAGDPIVASAIGLTPTQTSTSWS